MPSIGLGTYLMDREVIPTALRSAIAAGYRRIDCAAVYFNEDVIGDVLAQIFTEKLVNRQDMYVVSKLASPFHRKEHVPIALRKTLNDLRLDYLDLYLIHWPVALNYVAIDPQKRGFENEEIDSDGGNRIDPSVSVHETWQAMEALVDQGLVRNIGVSNFPVSLLHELLSKARIKPTVNQCESHPYLQQTKLLNYCNARGVEFQAYSPLGTPGYKESQEPVVLHDPILHELASKYEVSPAQVALAWNLQRGTSIVVKSVNEQRQKENLDASKLTLSDSDMSRIASLDRGYRFFRPEDWWGSMAMAVFH